MFANVLSRGYLPKELPPAFSAVSFGAAASALRRSPQVMTWRGTAKLCRHNLVRAGTLRRGLSIPNPVPFIGLTQRLTDDWTTVVSRIGRSTLSRSSPVYDASASNRCLRSASTYDDLPRLRAACRAGRRFICVTDISNFYSSIYTHSIPWAVDGKISAKANRRADTLGNGLDTWIRASQDGQTMGIPVGPDTSHVIAELVLSAVDEHFPRDRGIRFYDDYEFACDSAADAENTLSRLQQRLSEYELSLNPKKTEIFRLPQRLDAAWTSDLRMTEIRGGASRQRIDLLTYFDKMADHAQRHPDDNVMRYGVATLVNQPISTTNFPLYWSLLLQAASSEPGVLPSVLQSLLAQEQGGRKMPREPLGELLASTITRHAPLGHGSEVAWALWGALCFGIKLPTGCGTSIAGMDDSVVALLSVDAAKQGLLGGVDPTSWAKLLGEEALWGNNWLFSYEAGLKGWGGARHHLRDPAFKRLASAGVSFYTPVSAAQAKAEAAAGARKANPDY